MKPITVLLAEDHPIVRHGLRMLLECEADIKVVGEAEDGRQAVQMAQELAPAVIIMDIAMPLLNGLEAAQQIVLAMPGAKVLILSAYSDDAFVHNVLAHGAAGYIAKQTAANILPEAIRRVHAGKPFLSPGISDRLFHHQRKARARGELAPEIKHPALTVREREVLQLIAEGKTNKEMADVLTISVKTVEKHRQNVMEKLNIHDTAGLTRHAIATRVIESSVNERSL